MYQMLGKNIVQKHQAGNQTEAQDKKSDGNDLYQQVLHELHRWKAHDTGRMLFGNLPVLKCQ